jgi:hypothetical protein
LASFSPSKIRATAGVARCLRLNTANLFMMFAPLEGWRYLNESGD